MSAAKIVNITAGAVLCLGLGAGAHAAATYSSEPTVTAKVTGASTKPPIASKPDKNAKSWVDAFGRACTQVNPQGGAIALDCEYPPAALAAEPPFTPSTYTEESLRASVLVATTTAPVPNPAGGGAEEPGTNRGSYDGSLGTEPLHVDGHVGRTEAAASRTTKAAGASPVVTGRPRAVNPNPPIAAPTSAPAVVHSTPEVTLIRPVVYPCPEEDPESCAPQPETTPVPTVTRVKRAVNPTPTFEETTLP